MAAVVSASPPVGLPVARDAPAVWRDDMPDINDARRVMRLAMMVDEMRKICKAYVRDERETLRARLTDHEFCALGGRAVAGRDYSILRQLVYAKRDAKAFSQRRCFPASGAVKKAHAKYVFYDTDAEDVDGLDKKGPIKDRDAVRVFRIALVLKRFRAFFKVHGEALRTDAARVAFHQIRLSKEEFVQCGGHRTVSGKTSYSFYRQVVRAKRDMSFILERGHFAKGGQPPCVVKAVTDESDETLSTLKHHGVVVGAVVSPDALRALPPALRDVVHVSSQADAMSSDEGSDCEDALMELDAADVELSTGFLARVADGLEGEDDEDAVVDDGEEMESLPDDGDESAD